MARIKLSGGPLDGQERELDNTGALPAEYPGYAAVEQVMDPGRGQLLRAEWHGGEADEASYPGSAQERERYGNQTGVRDADAQDRARGKTTGAYKREAKDEVSDAKRK